MPKLWVKDLGTWKQVQTLWVKTGGVWDAVTTGLITLGGIGRQFYPDSPAITQTYFTPGTTDTFTVPANVTRISVTVRGASGGTGGSYASGTTARAGANSSPGQVVQGELTVTPGQVLTVQVGGGGGRGFQNWNSGTGGTAGSAYSGYAGSSGTTNANSGGGGGGGATVILSGLTPIVVAAGGGGGQGAPLVPGGSGGSGGGTNLVPSGCTASASTNAVSTTDNSQPGTTKTFSTYYSASYGTGGSGALSAVNTALTGVPNFSSAFTAIPTNNGNGRDFIISCTLKSGSGGFACYRTQAQQGAAFYAPGTALNIYAGQTVTGVNTSGNGGSSFWIHGPDIYNNGNNGFVQITVVPRVVSTVTLSSNTNNYTLTVGSIPGYVAGNTDVILVVNSGVTVSSTSTASAALLITGLNSADTVTINNSGTIVGAGGAVGTNNNGGAAARPYPGNYVGSFVTPNFANGYLGTGYATGPGAGGSTPGYNNYGGSGTGGAGSPGGPAISLSSNTLLTINNSGTIVGGGGGAGGQAGNNAGGGAGGNGGYVLEYAGTRPAVTLINTAAGLVASGGGASGGWGNRSANDGMGGRPGFAATNLNPSGAVGGNYGGNGISPGLAPNNTGTTRIASAGTFTLSPAV